MCIAVPISADCSFNSCRCKQIKIPVPSDQKFNILPLRDYIVQELVKAALYLHSMLYVPMTEKTYRVDIYDLTSNIYYIHSNIKYVYCQAVTFNIELY